MRLHETPPAFGQFCFAVLLAVLTGCTNFPRDPEHTLQQVQNQTLTAGITHHPPFTIVVNSDSLAGSEVELVKKLAGRMNAKVKWVISSEAELFDRLKKYEIDLVAGGITSDSPWKKHSGFTRPYLSAGKKKYVFAVPPGENAFLMEVEKFLFAEFPNQKP